MKDDFWFKVAQIFLQIITNSMLVGHGRYADVHCQKVPTLAVILSGLTSSDVNRRRSYQSAKVRLSNLSYNKSAQTPKIPVKSAMLNPQMVLIFRQDTGLIKSFPVGWRFIEASYMLISKKVVRSQGHVSAYCGLVLSLAEQGMTVNG